MSMSSILDPPLPAPKPVLARPIVKLQLPTTGASAVAYSEDRKIATSIPTGMASRRLKPNERAGYFAAEVFADGIVEIGERVATPTPEW
jgi:hypothetical protein